MGDKPSENAALPATARQFRFGDYEGLFEPVEHATHLVIALTGVGDTREPLKSYDFLRSLTAQKHVDRLFLRDHQRSWYRCAEGREALIAHLHGLMAQGGYRQVTLLGLSMGAYGALSLGEVLTEARVVALSPPISLDTPRYGRFIIRHKRWLDANAHFAGTDLRITGDRGRYLIILSDDEIIDIANLSLFLEADWPGLFVLPGASHNIAGALLKQGRLEPFMRRLAGGAPLTALAAAAGAYPAYADCHAIQMLRARQFLYRGEVKAADECLADAVAAIGTGTMPLVRLLLMRQGLQGEVAAALAQGEGLPWPSVKAPFQGGVLELESAEARMSGQGPQLGPLVRGCLRLDGVEKASLAFEPEAPPALNQGGEVALAAYVPDGAGYRLVAESADPKAVMSVPLMLRNGVADFVLHRRCFGSGYDARRNDSYVPWSMKLKGLAVSA